MIGRLEVRLRHLRRLLSRSEWGMRWLGLQPEPRASTQPGLVLIQIDGLARRQLHRALAKGRMPFLRDLLRRQGYHEQVFYSGLPASTPAVQGELHYGIPCAVPAFSYYDREQRRIATMFNPVCAQHVEQRLAAQAEGLLSGGASYGNIYTGGAQEAHFCASSSGWGETLRRHFPLALPLLILVNLWSVLRIVVLTLLELLIALSDMARGISRGQSVAKEIKFVFTRALICIVMRELIVIGTKIDVTRGLPVIHLNFLGYDEQSHRRGPDSLFAHWALKGIDDAIKRIWNAAHGSTRRHYDVWLFADHGQEAVRSYHEEHGRGVEEAIAEVFSERGLAHGFTAEFAHRLEAQRGRVTGGRRKGRRGRRGAAASAPPAAAPTSEHDPGAPQPAAADQRLIVAAMGPVGHIYIPGPLAADLREEVVDELLKRVNLPMVLAVDERDPTGEVIAWTRKGRFSLPRDGARLLGDEHPFLPQVAHDLAQLVRHPDAGDLVFLGWRRRGKPLSFPIENGSHAGPGPHETEAWALLPADVPLPPTARPWLRPADLRAAALRHLGRAAPAVEFPREEPPASASSVGPTAAPARQTLRILSYNVHSCIGMDGRMLPERIARVIAQMDPDVVALQELDVGRERTGHVDQARLIAERLRMEHHFHPALSMEDERYGDAVLSRLPMQLVRAGALPGPAGREPRGAVWVRVEAGGVPVQIINTHLGLGRRERPLQAMALAGPAWLGDPACQPPIVLCGDFNSLPRSRPWRLLTAHLRDAQLELERHRPRATWFGRLPLGRIDHVFISPGLEVVSIQVPRNRLALVASDHLPVLVELRVPASMPPEAAPATPGHTRTRASSRHDVAKTTSSARM